MKKITLQNPHDKFFRASMQSPHIAREFLQAHLPENLLAQIDLSQLTICQTTFIDEELKLSQADVLFQTVINNQTGYLYCLIEHQSKPDDLMPLRLLKYLIKIWEYWLTQHNKSKTTLPVIYPVVFYTGNKPWNVPCSIWEMCQDNSALMQAIWQAPFYLIELNKIEEESLKTRLRSGTMEFVMRYQFREQLVNELEKIAQNIHQLALEQDDHFLLQLLQYILAVDEKHRSINELVNQLHNKLPPSVEEKIMGLAERIYNDGQEQGIQQGIQQGKLEVAKKLLKQNLDVVLVANATNISVAILEKLKKESH